VTPTERGWRFLDDLFRSCGWPAEDQKSHAQFFSEFELPRRHEDEVSGWPDFAVRSPTRLAIIELKTEAGSHRRGQLAHYADLSAHHYPDHSRQLGYITPPLRSSAQHDPVPVAHLTWEKVAPVVRATWMDSNDDTEAYAASVLVDLLDRLGERWTALPASTTAPQPTPSEAVAQASEQLLAVAHLVADDGRQRAANVDWPDADVMDDTRLHLRDDLRGRGIPVQPWIWRAATSGGRALTESGQRYGYELRLSRIRAQAGRS
jgi:hypothetical protein